MIKVTLKDNVVKEYEAGTAIIDVAKSLGSGLTKAACCARVNGKVTDLRVPLTEDCKLEICTFDDDDGKRTFWHSSSHVLAQAVKRLYPAAKFAIGPSIKGGFYYDFDVEKPFGPEETEKIEAEMQKIIKEKLPIERFELDGPEALELMKDEPYKIELIKEHADKGEKLSFFRQGEFVDLCAGPHLMDISPIKAFKITSATGAYWRGDSNKAMLCRLYATSFPKASELEAHLAAIEEAKKRDHRKLGKELSLFALMDEGPGFPFFLPKGMIVRNELISFWREVHTKAGYNEISSPLMLNRSLWERSGHWDHYKDNIYATVIDDVDYAIKPMNCPGGILVYQTEMHSYRDLPLRLGELGVVHRHELSGALHGLMRVRCFTQDDAHIFMTPEQVKEEIKGVVTLIDSIYHQFGFKYHIELSTMPEDHMGEKAVWDAATESLAEAITELGMKYILNEGDGAFYGPKLDFHLEDSIGRTWQCGTIQLDFQMPERFELEYTGPDGEKHRPVMIHRTALGSIERFIGVLIEHFAGAFPTWLAPVQVKMIPVSAKYNDYAKEVAGRLLSEGVRVESDFRPEKMGYKIREAQLQKIPYMLVIGEKEMESGSVAVRTRKEGDGGVMKLEEFSAMISSEIANRE